MFGNPNMTMEYTQFNLYYEFSVHSNSSCMATQVTAKMPVNLFTHLVVPIFLKGTSFLSCKSHAAFVAIVQKGALAMLDWL